MRVAVLLTSHNRKEKTLKCLGALRHQHLPAGLTLDIFHVDDGSTDGTAEAIHRHFPSVHLIREDGNKFWNGGMNRAWGVASRHNTYDGFLWLNDDTYLYSSGVQELVRCLHQVRSRTDAEAIIVGATLDPDSGEVSYSGVVRQDPTRPLSFTRLKPGPHPVRCDTMNGNCVLVPRSVMETVGTLDPAFRHGMADFDYGLRARRDGIDIWLAPSVVGECRGNGVQGTWRDRSLRLRERLTKVRRPTGLPLSDWWIFTRRHGGPLWLALFVWPYAKIVLTAITRRLHAW